MLGQQDKNDRFSTASVGDAAGGVGAIPRKTYFRSVSWTDRSPTKPISGARHQLPNNSKARSCLPPLQPLTITRSPVEEWPTAGSDDLGVWPNPQTPRGPLAVKLLEKSNLDEQQPVREFQFKRDKLAFFDKECSRIANHIYLGSDAVAKNREILRQNGITHVLNCVGFVCPEYFKSDLVYKTLWLRDSPSEDITSILYDVFDYFEDVREQSGKVLVHCCQGVSRSTSLVIAYLMWREGRSFEDAFHYVKAARRVTNPNMGFACQLLQCHKRVHAIPASPNSVLRVYRMAPHSSYDPLHLVPKLLSQPDVRGLDSRGAFIVHVPTNIFVWVGKKCNSAMSYQAKVAANQVIRYERAQGPILIIKEREEPSEFWDALTIGRVPADDCQRVELRKEDALSSGNNNIATTSCNGVSERKVDEYDLDFELFYKALAGGIFPPFSVSNAESETCLPARENGWGRLRQKFASDSFYCFLDSSPDRIMNSSEAEKFVILTDPLLATPTPSGSPDSSPKFNYKSPTLSPSTSDYSSNSLHLLAWSPQIHIMPRSPLADNFCLAYKETPSSPTTVFTNNHALRLENTSLPLKRTFPTIAECRGSKPPPRLLLPSVDESSQVPRRLDMNNEVYEHQSIREQQILDADTGNAGNSSQSCKVLCEEGKSELIRSTGSHKHGHLHWELIIRNFLNQINFPDNIPMRIVREGEEPEQFLNLVSGFSFQKVEDNSEKIGGF
ncbi:dual specificity protein phosphatase, putative [Ricinus communis]|uniref:Dual specificity protein phosphatase, putative n=1 Tax=Ricinus communis TaxID=3988 RepID=B9SVN2_RICCO|nr:dual specificity protein phosphatase, putative [Ricinus communis]